jgi:hypothetical protein
LAQDNNVVVFSIDNGSWGELVVAGVGSNGDFTTNTSTSGVGVENTLALGVLSIRNDDGGALLGDLGLDVSAQCVLVDLLGGRELEVSTVSLETLEEEVGFNIVNRFTVEDVEVVVLEPELEDGVTKSGVGGCVDLDGFSLVGFIGVTGVDGDLDGEGGVGSGGV